MNLETLVGMYLSPTSLSIWINILVFGILGLFLKYCRNSKFTVMFELGYEKMYDFFADIMGKEEKLWVITFVMSLFFVILFFNFQGIVVEFLAPIFGMSAHGTFLIEHYIVPASSDINFNIAMSSIAILVLVFVQFSSLGVKDFFKTYFPVTGHGYLTVERGDKTLFMYLLNYIPVKAFDIVVSMFLGLLDLIGLLAKIVSLSFRLFGNMTSGAVLLAMSVMAISSMTTDWFGFAFPIGLPVLIYLQEMLIGGIQALVFSLLVAIFIKVARVS